LAFLYGWHFLNKISLDWPCTIASQPSTSKLAENCVEFTKKYEGLLSPGKRKTVHNNEVSVKRGSTILVGLRKQPAFCHHWLPPQNDV